MKMSIEKSIEVKVTPLNIKDFKKGDVILLSIKKDQYSDIMRENIDFIFADFIKKGIFIAIDTGGIEISAIRKNAEVS